MVRDLRPPELDLLGVGAALRTLTGRSSRLGLEVQLEADLDYEQGRASTRHTPDLESTIYRIVQEALHNVAKHSGATEALVRISESGSELELLVKDSGCGFDPLGSNDGFGLVGIHERAELLGGSVEISSSPGAGFTLRARLPVNRRDVA